MSFLLSFFRISTSCNNHHPANLHNRRKNSIAGSDTTATAIRMTLLSLISTPAAFAALRRELDAAAAAGRLSSPVRDAEAKSLPYLQAVIREGLRLYPPSTGLVSKQVPPGGDTIHGYFLPGGTQVGENVCSIGRDRDVFGPDAHHFRPERWIEAAEEADGERYKEMLATVDLVFGYGKFYCMGRTIALMELNKVFVEVSRRISPSCCVIYVSWPKRKKKRKKRKTFANKTTRVVV